MLTMALYPQLGEGKAGKAALRDSGSLGTAVETRIWELGLRYWIERSGGHINPL